MFGRKKEDETGADKPMAGDAAGAEDPGAAPPLKPFSRKGSHAPAKPPVPASHHPEFNRRPPEIPGMAARRIDRPRTGEMESRRLIVGREIRLNGEITACDKLVVEGHVEVTLPGARVLEISPSGFFKGKAEVDEADVSGRFEGELIARERLVIRSGGRVHGSVRYGRIVIESGGEISGDMQTLQDGGSTEPSGGSAGGSEGGSVG